MNERDEWSDRPKLTIYTDLYRFNLIYQYRLLYSVKFLVFLCLELTERTMLCLVIFVYYWSVL